MTVLLIIISFYGGIERVPMGSAAVCETAAREINFGRSAKAYCIRTEP